jgi:Protein of unknown function with PCYCGC motif
MLKRILTASIVFVLPLTLSAQYSEQAESGVPAFNKTAPAKGVKQPPILKPESLWGENGGEAQIKAYTLAAKIPDTLHQLPCYCYCSRSMGHKSLRSCFEGTHGAQCDTCMKELFYAYGEKQKGKTVAQIRKGIIDGEWKSVTSEQAQALN